jgi:uncharacterized membrane protein
MNDSSHVSELIPFLGAFHPVLVHLPVGFIVLLAALEALALHPRFKHLTAASRAILMLTLPAVFGTALTGWLLAERGGYDADLLSWHRWAGVAVAIAVLFVLAAQRFGRPWIYRLSLCGTLLLVIAAGHWGGSLTHGRDYLASAAPAWLRSLIDPPPAPTSTADRLNQPVYKSVIQPIFTRYCVSCHGPEKAKAGLRLNARENLLKGSDSGPVIEPGSSARSLLIQQLLSDPDDQNHMPPDGKPQPTPNDIALLEWWVDAGLPANETAAELNPPPPIVRILGLSKSATQVK